jgi:enoyl-CoA hydratase/carnithine racemase
MKNLTQLVGPGFAKDIFFTGRRLDAAEALRIGLVNRVAEPTGSTRCSPSTRARSAPARRSPSRAGKRIIRDVLKTRRRRHGARAQADPRCFESEDYAEGRTAFMEKRKPVFKGK